MPAERRGAITGASATASSTNNMSLFGSSTPAPAPGGFGSSTPAPAPTGGFSFGSSSTPGPAPAFGSNPAPAPSGGGLFGSTPAPAPSSTFGTAPAPSSTFGGFGSTTPAPSAGGGGSLFGAPAPSTGLFGTPAPAPSGGSLFGAPAPAPSGGLFGAPAPASGGLFGGTPAPATGGMFGTPAAQTFQAAPSAAPAFTGSSQYASLPDPQKQVIDRLHQAMMNHKRTVAMVTTMAPKLLHREHGAPNNDLPPSLSSQPKNSLNKPEPSELSRQIEDVSKQVHAMHQNMEKMVRSVAVVNQKYETLLTQTVQYGKWPTEAVAVRRGIALASKASLPPKTEDEKTQQKLKELLDIQMSSVDRIERMPSPYFWQLLHDMEERLTYLQSHLEDLRMRLNQAQRSATAKQQSQPVSVTSVVQLQHESLWQLGGILSDIRRRVDDLRLLYRQTERGDNVLDKAEWQARMREETIQRKVKMSMVKEMPATAPAPGATAGGIFGGSTPAPASTFGGGLFGKSPAPAPSGGGLFGSNAAPAPSGGLFGSSTPAPAPTTGGGLFGSAPAPAASGPAPAFGAAPAPTPAAGGGLFGSTPAPAFGAQPAPAPAAGGGLFGSNPAPAPAGGGLFGSAATAGTTRPGSNLTPRTKSKSRSTRRK